MLTSDFHFDLPDELIARHPTTERTDSRLLVVDRSTGHFDDIIFRELPDYLAANDCLVFNNTRVIPARLFGHKPTGGRVEILIERLLDEHRALVMLRASKTPKPGSTLSIDSRAGDKTHQLSIESRDDCFFLIRAEHSLATILEDCGHVPLPPYIDRDDEQADHERYQTVYAAQPGAVAAPTAGLHFDDKLLARIEAQGVNSSFVTLHVGAGTFQPVRSEDIREHAMHTESLQVDADTVDACRQARDNGGRIIAVGTTSVRSLETASQSGELQAFAGETDIFIYPGYRFRSVDALITNFHLPESTLIMLVSAFAGRELTLAAYQHAIEQRYRFFSYGDAMLIV